MEKLLKIKFIVLIIFIISLLTTVITYGHPGRTDSNGGHTNHSTGEYHYHHGYSAHQHPNGVCPYEFNDAISEQSFTTNNTTSANVNTSDKIDLLFDKLLTNPIGQFVICFIIIYAIYFIYCIYDKFIGIRIHKKQYESESFDDFYKKFKKYIKSILCIIIIIVLLLIILYAN